MKKRKHVQIGEISDASLTATQLANALVATLKEIRLDKEETKALKSYIREIPKLSENVTTDALRLQDIIDEMQLTVEDYLLPFTTLRTIGTEYTVVVDHEDIRRAVDENSIAKTNTLLPVKILEERGFDPVPEYQMVVNDHGNIAMHWRARGKSRWKLIWAVV